MLRPERTVSPDIYDNIVGQISIQDQMSHNENKYRTYKGRSNNTRFN